MADLVHNETLSVDGLKRLLEQYKGKETFETLLEIYLDAVQELEDSNWNMRLAFMLENAEGEQLDFLGAMVGERRSGKLDAVYRIWIGVRIRLNRSFGRPIDVLECLRLATDVEFELREYEDACFGIFFAETPEYPNDLTLIAHLAKAAGVGLVFVYPTDLGAGTSFRFKNVGDPDVAANGFADANDL
jgi:hypothetical protein